MTYGLRASMVLAMALSLISGGALAQREHEHGRFSPPHAETRQAEPQPGPLGYPRVYEPRGWNIRPSLTRPGEARPGEARPGSVDRGTYQHNFQASRPYRIGPYRAPPGWQSRRWGYGDILPPVYRTAPYLLLDYWLFGLEIPPLGFEWVRVGADALLTSVATGEVLQVVYGLFI